MSVSRNSNEDPRLEHAIAEYLGRLDGGEEVDRLQFLNDHPSCAPDLAEYFEVMDQVEQMAGPPLRDPKGADEPESSTPGKKSVRDVWDGKPLPFPFDRYHVIRRLGRGGMGSVYLARDNQLAREVALKIPQLFGHDDDPKRLERFIREARMNVQHPNICTIHDVGIRDGQPFISMAYIKGQPLAALIAPESLLNEREIAVLIRTVSLAMYAAHQSGIVHRDLKPGNIMIDEEGVPFVMDFGLANRLSSDDARLTSTGMLVGTPAYLAPEQLECRPESLTHATDIYSLGVTFYELLTGRRPFQGTLVQILMHIQDSEPEPPSRLRPGLSPGLEAICLRMMAKRPADRFATMKAVAVELDHWLEKQATHSELAGEVNLLRRQVRLLGIGVAAAVIGPGLLEMAESLAHHLSGGEESHTPDQGANDLPPHDSHPGETWHSPLDDLFSDHSPIEKADPHFGTPEHDRAFWDGQQSYEDTCAIRCQEYILQQFTGQDLPEKLLVDEARQHGWYSPGHGTSMEDVGNLLELHGVAVNRYSEANAFHLANELAQGHKVIIGVDSSQLWGHNPTMDSMLTELHDHFGIGGAADHAVVVSGIDTTDPYSVKVIISDPGDGKAMASYPLEQFLHAWEGSHFYMVATREPAPANLPEMAHFDYSSGHLPSIADVVYERFVEQFAHHPEAWEQHLVDYFTGDHHADSGGHGHDLHHGSGDDHTDPGGHEHELDDEAEHDSHDLHHHDGGSDHDDPPHDDWDAEPQY